MFDLLPILVARIISMFTTEASISAIMLVVPSATANPLTALIKITTISVPHSIISFILITLAMMVKE